MRLVPPGLRELRGYRPSWLGKDLVAGAVLTALLVPQGMAYAELAGLPAITGLYTSITCLLGTTPLTSAQFLLALAAAVLLFVLWEAGKLVARRRTPR